MRKASAAMQVRLTMLALLAATLVEAAEKTNCDLIVIAHRGASGYVPEHTLGAYALAVTMGADYLEPDLVMTSDGHLVARHENEISLSTDVAEHPEFLARYKTQTIDTVTATGWFTEDFTLAELKTLRAIERIPAARPGNTRMNKTFEIPTMQEIIDLAKGMQEFTKRPIGIYPEIKHSTHFQRLGLAMERPLVDLLHKNGYKHADSPIMIQSFEVTNLKELKNLTDLRLIQLYGSRGSQPFDQFGHSGLTYGDMSTPSGLRDVADYAYGVGPDKNYIIPRVDGKLGNVTDFVRDAHAAGLKVHPYTFRAENVFLPVEYQSGSLVEGIGDLRGEIEAFVAAGIDGLFADQPDVAAVVRGPCLPSASTVLSVNLYVFALVTSFIVLR
ncbi:hypothetical protein JYU34_011441 [Plutella xylostella]|uniref:glycerophosphodiester phosphodiesterase n=1 Tax=Plutella xylostella TaxID=51655 RepID=A0ABQ7QH30_PLUXY|nr:hypothetical protein JYU34_011441 [Plutella xylostella]